MKRTYWKIGTGLASGLALGGVIWAGSLWAQHSVIIDRAGASVAPGKAVRSRITVDGPVEFRREPHVVTEEVQVTTGRATVGKAARSRVTIDGPLEARSGNVIVTEEGRYAVGTMPPDVAGGGTTGAMVVAPHRMMWTPGAAMVEAHVEMLSDEDRAAQARAAEADRRAMDFALQARQTAANRSAEQTAEVRRQLERLVADAFQARQEIQQRELRELADRLKKVELQVANRQARRERIIERRVSELLDPDLQWEQGGPVLEGAQALEFKVGAAADAGGGPAAELTPAEAAIAAGADVIAAVPVQPGVNLRTPQTTVVVERVRNPDGTVIEERIQGPSGGTTNAPPPDDISGVKAARLNVMKLRQSDEGERVSDDLGFTPRHATLLAGSIAEAQMTLKTSDRVQDVQVARAKLAAAQAELRTILAMTEADLASKEAQLKYFQTEHERSRILFGKGVIPASEMQGLQARLQICEASIAKSRALASLFERLAKEGAVSLEDANAIPSTGVTPSIPAIPASPTVPAPAPAPNAPPAPATGAVPAAPLPPAAPSTKPAPPEPPKASTSEGPGTAAPASDLNAKPANPIVASQGEPTTPAPTAPATEPATRP